MASIAIQVGIMAGSMLVQYLTARRVKRPPTDKGRYDDIRIQGSDYGAYIPRIWGKVRFAPQIVFSNGIQHYTVDSGGGSGGKGGGGNGNGSGGTVREHVYQTSVALLACHGPIVDFVKIWADADVLSGSTVPVNQTGFEAENATLAGGANAVADADCSNGQKVVGVGNGGTVSFDFASFAPTFFPEDPPELVLHTQFTFYYKSIGNKTAYLSFDGNTPEPYLFLDTADALATRTILIEGEVATCVVSNPSADAPDLDRISFRYVFIHQIGTTGGNGNFSVSGFHNPKILYPSNPDDPSDYYDYYPPKNISTGEIVAGTPIPSQSIRFYTGTETQTPDSAIVAYLDQRFGVGEGVKRASAMRGLAYVMLENITIPNGRLQNFTMEVNQGTTSVGQIIKDLYAEARIPETDVDVSDLSGLTLTGLIVYQSTPAAEIIKKLEMWFDFEMVENNGKFVAVREDSAIVATLTAQDLRGHNFGDTFPDFDDDIMYADEVSLPREVHVTHLNPALDYHNETQTAQLFAATNANEKVELNFPFVSTPDEARKVAEKYLLKTHIERTKHSFSTLPKHQKLQVGDRVTLQLATRNYDVKLKKKAAAIPSGRIDYQAVASDASIYSQIQSKTNTESPHGFMFKDAAQPNFPANSKLVIFESTPLIGQHGTDFGVYMAVCGRGLGTWNGATVFRETLPEQFESISQIEIQANIGVAQNTLGNFTPSGETLDETDETNGLTIFFHNTTNLESITLAEAEANPQSNLIRIGDEWLQFLTATAEVFEKFSYFRSAWTISNLRRGKFGTGQTLGSHLADENCIVATGSLKWRKYEPQEIGLSQNFKVVTVGQDSEVGQITAHAFEPQNLYLNNKFDLNLKYSDSGRLFGNKNADVLVIFQLPLVKEKLIYRFVCIEKDGMQIQADASETIIFDATEGSPGGNINTSSAGSYAEIEGINGKWVCRTYTGVWFRV